MPCFSVNRVFAGSEVGRLFHGERHGRGGGRLPATHGRPGGGRPRPVAGPRQRTSGLQRGDPVPGPEPSRQPQVPETEDARWQVRAADAVAPGAAAGRRTADGAGVRGAGGGRRSRDGA